MTEEVRRDRSIPDAAARLDYLHSLLALNPAGEEAIQVVLDERRTASQDMPLVRDPVRRNNGTAQVRQRRRHRGVQGRDLGAGRESKVSRRAADHLGLCGRGPSRPKRATALISISDVRG